jgi:Mrp family chromosome partitioning ATPase
LKDDDRHGARAQSQDFGVVTAASSPSGIYRLSSELVTLGTANTPSTEAVRGAAAQLIVRQVESGRRGLAVCGVSPGVGVSFIAANLAIALSQAGVSTLLVDGNLHDPAVERLFAPADEAIGLQQLLRSDRYELADVVRDEALPDLSLLYAGGRTTDGQDLIGGARFRRVMDGCLRDFQFTIVDTPAANRWPDGLRIAGVIGYGLVVARQDVSFVDDIETLSADLERGGASVVGSILNNA